MKNPFEDLVVKTENEVAELGEEQQQKEAKRGEIYKNYDPMVNQVLDMFITAHRQGIWEKGSDCLRRYCCHISWYAGPREKYSDPYDEHHDIRRRLEVTLEMDGLCNPTGFRIANYEAIEKIIHVGLRKDDLVRGIKEVMA
jgi:hypothetical protein